MNAAFPGTLFAVNENVPAQRTAGGILLAGFQLQFVYPAADGYVSITFLFGETIGPFTARLMEWVHETGFCDEAMRDNDWEGFGLALFIDTDAPAYMLEAEAAIADIQPFVART